MGKPELLKLIIFLQLKYQIEQMTKIERHRPTLQANSNLKSYSSHYKKKGKQGLKWSTQSPSYSFKPSKYGNAEQTQSKRYQIPRIYIQKNEELCRCLEES